MRFVVVDTEYVVECWELVKVVGNYLGEFYGDRLGFFGEGKFLFLRVLFDGQFGGRLFAGG